MNGIKEWSAILCLAALASCMLEMIIPSGRMEKIMRFVLGGFLLCAMISPISNLDFHFPDLEVSDSSQAQSFSAHFEQQVVDAARANDSGSRPHSMGDFLLVVGLHQSGKPQGVAHLDITL